MFARRALQDGQKWLIFEPRMSVWGLPMSTQWGPMERGEGGAGKCGFKSYRYEKVQSFTHYVHI